MAVATIGINLVGSKCCSKCNEEKPYGEFHRRSNRSGGLMSTCKKCEQLRAANKTASVKRALYERHRERQLERYREKAYGVTPERYQEMVASQNGVCAICEQPETTRNKRGEVRQLAVDHDHETGAIRGLLCASCNCALGYMKDDQSRLLAAVRYLEGSK